MAEIKLGQTVRDELTGFKGVVEAITNYLNGCCQALVRPKFKRGDDEYPKAGWIDLEQTVVKGTKILKFKRRKDDPPNGGVRCHPDRG